MALTEFGLIENYFTELGPADNTLLPLRVGDDCALLNIPAGQQLATSIDTLVAGVHFPAQADPYNISRRALRVTVSDLAAMGAQPLAFTLALTLPAADPDWLAAFSRGLRADAEAFAIALIGGDTTAGPVLTITIQVLGLVPAGAALLRSGARPGDAVLVSGTLGDAHAALACLEVADAELNAEQRYWLDRYYTPAPRLALGAALRGLASAAIDVSDGLAADLGHILRRSAVGAVLELDTLPLSDALRIHPQARTFALSGGDDYELCFTVPAGRLAETLALAQSLNLRLTRIGTITREPTLLGRNGGGDPTPLSADGYRHF